MRSPDGEGREGRDTALRQPGGWPGGAGLRALSKAVREQGLSRVSGSHQRVAGTAPCCSRAGPRCHLLSRPRALLPRGPPRPAEPRPWRATTWEGQAAGPELSGNPRSEPGPERTCQTLGRAPSSAASRPRSWGLCHLSWKCFVFRNLCLTVPGTAHASAAPTSPGS